MRLTCFCGVPTVVAFAAIVVTALKSKVEGNWAVDSYISGLILTAAVLVRVLGKPAMPPSECLGRSQASRLPSF